MNQPESVSWGSRGAVEEKDDFLGLEKPTGGEAFQAAVQALRRHSHHAVGACRDGNGDDYGYAAYFYDGPIFENPPLLTVGGYGSVKEAAQAIPEIQVRAILDAYRAALSIPDLEALLSLKKIEEYRMAGAVSAQASQSAPKGARKRLLTPTELGREFGMHRRKVIALCQQRSVPIYQGRIDFTAFAAVVPKAPQPESKTEAVDQPLGGTPDAG